MSDTEDDEVEEREDRSLLGTLLESKMTLMVVGFVLTTVLGGLLNSWIQNEQWKRESQFEIFQNQIKDGDKFQSEILDTIGTMRRHLNAARLKAKDAYFKYKNAPPANESAPESGPSLLAPVSAAKTHFREIVDPSYQELAYSIHKTRNKMALLFGPHAAKALLNRDDNKLHFDKCSVLTRIGDSGVNENCAKRRVAENAAILAGEKFRNPESMFHAIRVSRFLIKRMIWCMDPREVYADKETKCEDMPLLQSLMDRRYNQSGLVFNELSDRIFEQMVKLNASTRE